MISVYVLSYDDRVVHDDETLFVYRWVKVGWHQVKNGMSSVRAIPEDNPGDIVRYSIEDRGQVLLRVLGNGKLRELSKKEAESDIVKIKAPRI